MLFASVFVPFHLLQMISLAKMKRRPQAASQLQRAATLVSEHKVVGKTQQRSGQISLFPLIFLWRPCLLFQGEWLHSLSAHKVASYFAFLSFFLLACSCCSYIITSPTRLALTCSVFLAKCNFVIMLFYFLFLVYIHSQSSFHLLDPVCDLSGCLCHLVGVLSVDKPFYTFILLLVVISILTLVWG